MLTFRLATEDDAEVMHQVTQRAYAARPAVDPPSTALSETAVDVRADLAEHGGLIAYADGEAVASLRFRFDGRVAWLRRVGVVPEQARRGVGTHLVTYAHGVLARRPVEDLHVGVRFALADNRRFWETLSYADFGSDEHSYILSRTPPYLALVATGEEMRDLGRRLAALLAPGDVVVCIGELGAGKTTFAQGVGAGLGVETAITSPTFVLARAHRGPSRVPFVHADAYRLGGVADPLGELDALDLDASVDEAVTLVEWGAGLAERLAASRVEVRMDVADDETRSVVIDGLGPRWAGVNLRAALGAVTAP
ncbi:MAG: tRNA (adenosine(37)-N6)-threonylcarbamoyltransferase complex ATPase subunit type 1 TsaE [Actinomycetes bacterium]